MLWRGRLLRELLWRASGRHRRSLAGIRPRLADWLQYAGRSDASCWPAASERNAGVSL